MTTAPVLFLMIIACFFSETVVNTITLPYEENEAVFGGIQMNTFYQIHLTCLFPDEAFYDCGEVSIFTSNYYCIFQS